MAWQVFFNNANAATLSAPINASATSFTLQTGEGESVLPLGVDEYFYATIGTEVVKVTARTGDTFTCDETNSGWPAGTSVVQYVTAEMMYDMAPLDGGGELLDNYVFRGCSESATTSPAISANALTINMAHPYRLVTLNQNVTSLSFTNVPPGSAASVVVEFVQDSSGGKTVTWPSSVKTPNGVPLVIGSAANAISIVVLMTRDGGTTFYASLFGVNFA